MPKYFVFLLLFLSPLVLSDDLTLRSFFIVWNVGQGQWATLVQPETCHHFDMGGETNPLGKVQKICRRKMNRVYLSHWDWDHISFALKAQKVLRDSCLSLAPLGKSSPYKMKLLKAYSPCESKSAASGIIRKLTAFSNLDLNKKSNDLSHVVIALDKILIPGDSPQSEEKKWLRQIPTNNLRILLLGHHGSRTSTSKELLSRLHELKVAVASARSSRYGHPHPLVLHRLQKHSVPVLKTEDWGNIWFDSP